MISYDLINPGQNYPKIHEAIEKLGTYNHVLESTYLVICNLSITDLENLLVNAVDKNDRFVICQVTGTIGGYLKTDDWPTIHSNFDC